MKLPGTWSGMLVLMALVVGCAGPEKDAADFEPAIDAICRSTGMVRAGSIRSITRWNTESPGYNVKVPLKVDGKVRSIIVVFESDKSLRDFQPENFSLLKLPEGLGRDSVENPAARRLALAAVQSARACVQTELHGSGAIQKLGKDFTVTFETLSAAEIRRLISKRVILDPYVTFVVSPKGTVFAVLFGA